MKFKAYSLTLLVVLASNSLAQEIKISDVESQYSSKKNIEASKELKQSINLGFSNTTGDSKNSNLNAKYDLSFTTKGYEDRDLEVLFDASAFYDKTNGVKSNEEYSANLDLEQMINSDWLAYASLSWLQNKFRNLDNKYDFGVGFGTYLFKQNDQSLKLKIGIARNVEEFTNNQEKETFTSANQYLEYNNKLNDVSSFYAKLGVKENIDDTSDYQATGVAGLNFSVAKNISLSIEEEIDYDKVPPVGFKKTNTKSIVRIGYNF